VAQRKHAAFAAGRAATWKVVRAEG
jgi:hypothetical protein